MPTITVNRKVLERVIGKKLPESELKDRISMLGTDLEDVTDDEITVEIFPNRPDMLSEQGFGRALSSFIGVKTGLRKYNVKKSNEKVFVSKDMKNIRPYTVCAIIKNLKLDDEKIRELIQIQEKLHITFCRKRKKAAIGIYPMEKIKFPIYFTAKKPEDIVFRPLEWHKEINANEILKQHPTGIEYKHLVKGLKKYAIFHDANNDVLSLTPVINSHKTGKITDETKEAFLEVSGFDLHTAEYVLNIMVTGMADMGADIYSMDVVYPDNTIVTPNLNPTKMKIELSYINKWLGLKLNEKQLIELLEKMGFGYVNGYALVPAYRPDILHQADLAEDIAIAYGYENFNPEIPSKATVGKEDEFEKFRKKVSQLLVGLNFLETSSYHLSSEKVQFNKMNNKADDFIKLGNSVSDEFNIMRYSILANLMQILSENTHNEYPQNIFESGYVFKMGESDTGVVESSKLSTVICDNKVDYTKIRQVLDYIFKSFGLDYIIKEGVHPSFINGRVGKVILNNKEIGFVGEINPQVISNFEVEMPISGFEVDLNEIFNALYTKEDTTQIKVGDKLVSINNEISKKVPGIYFKFKVVKDINVSQKPTDEIQKRIDKVCNKLKLKNPEIIKLYEDEFNLMNYPKSVSPAVKSLHESIVKNNLPKINSAVNTANLISMEEMIPIAVFDLDKIKGNIVMRFAKKGESYIPIGKKQAIDIKEGIRILQDSEKIIAMFGVRDSAQTQVDLNTKNILLASYGLKGIDKKEMNKALDMCEELLK